MPTVYQSVEVEVDVDLDDFDDVDIRKEFFARNLDEVSTCDNNVYAAAVAALRQGRKAEAFILLERCLPELKGLLT